MSDKSVAILLVEDDAVDVMNVKRAFAKGNLANPIFEATNGIEALELLRRDVIPSKRLVLLDLNMPRMNGIEFLRELRNDPPDAPWDTAATFDAIYKVAKARGLDVEY